MAENADSSQEALDGLREALRLSPQNVPLRLHYAQSLLNFGFYPEAEKEFKHLLTLDARHEQAKLGLASAFYQQGKNSHALVILEDLLKDSKNPARAHLLQ